jgi:group I intron endonuclease
MPVNYQNGKIYKIVNNQNNIVYIGSTANTLCKRMYGHKGDSKKESCNDRTFYKAVNQIGVENFKIILIKNFPCSDRNELTAEEYRILREMRDNGEQLYNEMIDGNYPMLGKTHTKEAKQKMSEAHIGKTPSEESKQKMSESKKGEKHPGFKCGSVYHCKTHNVWLFKWIENGKRKRKSFSISKYGDEGAIQLCREYRKKIYPSYTTKYCEWFYIVEKDEFLVFPPS